jgi:glycosyltransferase involved in cell wall biosynthesis
MEEKLIVINTSKKYSGTGRYNGQIIRASSLPTHAFSFILSKSNLKNEFDGDVVMGVYPPISSGWSLNFRFPRQTFRSAMRGIENEITTDTILHYTDTSMMPPLVNENSVVTIHDLIPIDEKYGYDTRQRNYFLKALKEYGSLGHILTVSEYSKNVLEDSGLVQGNISVIHPFAEDAFHKITGKKEDLRKKYSLPLDKKLILSVTSNDVRKNLQMVHMVTKALGENYALVRVGPPLEGSFTFSGINDESLNELYNACDVLFIPSLLEGFCYPLLEGMAAGIPVVASDLDVLVEVSGNLALHSSNVVEDYVEKIKYAMDDNEGISDGERHYVEREYSLEKFSNNLNKYYKEVLS